MSHIYKKAAKRWAAALLAIAMPASAAGGAAPASMPPAAAGGAALASLMAASIMPSAAAAYADAAELPIDIFLNGMRLVSDVAPVVREDRTFVPVRVIGEALGYAVGYDDGLVTLRHEGLGMDISMAVGDLVATINGRRVELPVPAFIENGRTMAPVRFLSEALDSRVDWVPGYGALPDSVVIHCPYPVDANGGKAQIATRVEERRWELAGGYNGTVEVYYDLCIPIFTILSNEGLAHSLNESISLIADPYRDEITAAYEVQLAVGPDERYDEYEEFSYRVAEDNGRVMSMIIEGYSYHGGAHGMPFWASYNIDFDKDAALALPDLFKGGVDFEAALFRQMGALRAASPEEYEDVDEPDYIDYSSFYFEGGDLILYYPPYDLSYYARGFVEFRIPRGRLAGELLDEYL